MKESFKERISRLRLLIAEKEIDTLLILGQENRRYLTGFTGADTSFNESAGALFITEDRVLLATDSRYKIQAQTEAPFCEFFIYKKGLADSITEILTSLGTENLGFEGSRLSYAMHDLISRQIIKRLPDVKMFNTDNIVERLRRIKGPDEIDSIKEALALAEDVFLLLLERIKPGMTEKEVAWMLESMLMEAGAETVSFPVIVASGPTSAMPHAVPGKKRIREKEPLLFDWGIKIDGYCSDISRTVFFKEPDPDFSRIYRTVESAQKRAIIELKSGNRLAAEIDRVARKIIEKEGFAGKFGHGLGHGVGLAVHEAPRLAPESPDELEPGMVFTIEPGIYIEGAGGVRLENMVLVEEKGITVLNRTGTNDYVIG